MSVMIYINGEVETNAQGESLKSVLEIKDGWGCPAFRYEHGILNLYESADGSDPINDAVRIPLNRLAELAKKDGFCIEGTVNITSEWSECDSRTFVVENGNVREVNTEIHNVDTYELIEELERRGIRICVKTESKMTETV